MIGLFLLLELCTEEKGNFSLEFNPHKSYYEKPKEYLSERYEKDEFKHVDLSKDFYILQWYQHTPIGFYTFIENDINTIINRILTGALDAPEWTIEKVADSIHFHDKYIFAHPQHEPIAIAKGGKIEPIITVPMQHNEAIVKLLNGRRVFGNWINQEGENDA